MILPKVQIKKVLYATDLSEGAIHAFAYAVNLANMYDATLTILHVIFEDQAVDSIASFYIGEADLGKIKNQFYEDARQTLIGKKRENVAIEEILQKFSENAMAANDDQPFVTDEIIVKSGNPEDHILEQADERNCDIIVMGRHGHGKLADAIMGSTARSVLRRSQKPIFIVPISDSR
jgi:nucleotide-binding universal stress UspA family protein